MLFLSTLIFVPDWFATNKILEILDNVFFNDHADSDNVMPFSDDMGLVNVDVNNVSLNNVNFDNDDPENIIHVTLIAWCKR